jgi:hypothetical protein
VYILNLQENIYDRKYKNKNKIINKQSQSSEMKIGIMQIATNLEREKYYCKAKVISFVGKMQLQVNIEMRY